MKNRLRIFALGISTVVLTGCSYIQSFFPDKERDYQYTTEIPMINWPTDLRRNQSGVDAAVPEQLSATPDPLDVPAASSEAPTVAEKQSEESSAVSPDATSPTPIAAGDSAEKDVVSSVEIIKYDDGESRLRLGAGFSKSWRVVSKALSRNSIEVTERNNEKGLFTVQYDPDEKKAKDDSFMDELSFFFHGINSNENQYYLKLEGHEQQTDVIVLDEEQLPLLNNESALRLLKVLADTTKADLAGQNKPE